MDVGGLGTTRLFFGEQFPAAHINSLIAGDTFLEMQTPQGSLDGQLIKIPEPSALSLLGLGGLLLARRRRHASCI